MDKLPVSYIPNLMENPDDAFSQLMELDWLHVGETVQCKEYYVHNRMCGPRISLTFRKYVHEEQSV